MAVMGKSHSKLVYSKFTLYKRGWFLTQRNAYFILCDDDLLPSRLCMRKVHLRIRSHKRGFGFKKVCVMNIRDLHHEYGGLVS